MSLLGHPEPLVQAGHSEVDHLRPQAWDTIQGVPILSDFVAFYNHHETESLTHVTMETNGLRHV